MTSEGQGRKLIVWDLDLEREANENAVLEAVELANIIIDGHKRSLQGHKHFISKIEFFEKDQHLISYSLDRQCVFGALKRIRTCSFKTTPRTFSLLLYSTLELSFPNPWTTNFKPGTIKE